MPHQEGYRHSGPHNQVIYLSGARNALIYAYLYLCVQQIQFAMEGDACLNREDNNTNNNYISRQRCQQRHLALDFA